MRGEKLVHVHLCRLQRIEATGVASCAADRLQPPFPPSYTVTLNADATVTDFTLDSASAIYRTPGGIQRQLNVTGESRLISGLVEWHDGLWKGGTLTNDADFDVYGVSYFGDFNSNGINMINNGRMRIPFVPGRTSRLTLDGNTTFIQASPDSELTIDEQLFVQNGASLSTTATAAGIRVQPLGFMQVGQSPGGTVTLDGGTLTIWNCTPLTDAGVHVAIFIEQRCGA